MPRAHKVESQVKGWVQCGVSSGDGGPMDRVL